MAKRIIRTDTAPVNAAYSQAVVSNGLVFVSG
jgi:enamine deaminase RidA (YjgF/YER057c/UK114 family)